MLTIKTSSDIFSIPSGPNTAVCVLTNGMVKSNGHAVMGAGQAKQADQMFHCSERLGACLSLHGNHVFDLGDVTAYGKTYRLIAFPTKHDWRNGSHMELIEQSAHELVQLCDKLGIQTCYLPPAGCGLGGLNWKTQVEPMLSKILDGRFITVLRS